MTEIVHRIWRYVPMVVEEAMAYEDDELVPKEIERTLPLNTPEIEFEQTRFECECGQSFDTEDDAEQHLAEVRNQ